MTRDQLLHPDVVDAAAEAAFADARLAAGDFVTRPWVMLMPQTRAVLRRMTHAALGAAWDAAEKAGNVAAEPKEDGRA